MIRSDHAVALSMASDRSSSRIPFSRVSRPTKRIDGAPSRARVVNVSDSTSGGGGGSGWNREKSGTVSIRRSSIPCAASSRARYWLGESTVVTLA